MHVLFSAEVKQETEDIQKEIDAVRKFLSQGPSTPSPSEATVIYGRKPGKGKRLVLAGAGAALAAGVVLYLVLAGPPAGENKAAPPPMPSTTKAAPREPVKPAKPPAPDAQAKTASPADKPAAAPLPAPPAAEPARKEVEPSAAKTAQPSAPQAEATPPILIQARKDIAEKKYDQALAALDELAKQAPEQAQKANRDRAQALIGRAMENLNQAPEKSLVDLAQAAEMAPDWAQVHFQAGRAQTRLKRLDAAVESYDKALKLDPKLDGAFFNRGYLYLQKGHFKEAAQDFQRVVELNSPYKSDAYVNLGICHFRLGDKAKALNMLEQALVANPNNRLAQDYLDKLKALSSKKEPKAR